MSVRARHCSIILSYYRINPRSPTLRVVGCSFIFLLPAFFAFSCPALILSISSLESMADQLRRGWDGEGVGGGLGWVGVKIGRVEVDVECTGSGMGIE